MGDREGEVVGPIAVHLLTSDWRVTACEDKATVEWLGRGALLLGHPATPGRKGVSCASSHLPITSILFLRLFVCSHRFRNMTHFFLLVSLTLEQKNRNVYSLSYCFRWSRKLTFNFFIRILFHCEKTGILKKLCFLCFLSGFTWTSSIVFLVCPKILTFD